MRQETAQRLATVLQAHGVVRAERHGEAKLALVSVSSPDAAMVAFLRAATNMGRIYERRPIGLRLKAGERDRVVWVWQVRPWRHVLRIHKWIEPWLTEANAGEWQLVLQQVHDWKQSRRVTEKGKRRGRPDLPEPHVAVEARRRATTLEEILGVIPMGRDEDAPEGG